MAGALPYRECLVLSLGYVHKFEGFIDFQARWASAERLGVSNRGSDRRHITHESRVEVGGASHHVWEGVKKC